jgi:hypothetical protein
VFDAGGLSGPKQLTSPLSRAMRPGRTATWLAAAAAVAALTALQMVRRPSDPPAWDSLSVEDGQVFLTQALSNDLWDSLRTSFMGYLHTAPRLITEVATWMPLEDAPLVISLLTSLLVAVLALYVFKASSAWIASPLLRVVLALSLVFVPVTARDIAGTVNNLHWYLLYASFWAVISKRGDRTWFAISAALVALTALSDPLCAVLLPLAIARAVRLGGGREWALPGAIVLAVIAHLVLRDDRVDRVGGVDVAAIPRIFAERVTSSLLVGDRYLHDVFGGRTGSLFAWASLVAVALLIGLGARRLRGRRAWLLAGAATLSIVFFLIPVLTRGTELLVPDIPWALGASRYMYLPIMFLLTAVIAVADRPGPAAGRRLPLRELVLAVAVVVVTVANYDAVHRTTGGPRWKPALADARDACRAGHPVGEVRLNRQGASVTAIIPTHPLGHWSVAIACSRLV